MTCVARMAAYSSKITKGTRKRKQQNPGHALKACLRQAGAQKRLTVGLTSCVNKLKRNPESAMVCLQLHSPTPSGTAKDEAVCNIQHMLLQAFCAESRISMVQVKPEAGLMRLIVQLSSKMNKDLPGDCCNEGPVDCSLIVIEYPAGPPSSEDMMWLAACEWGHLDLTPSHLPSD